MILSDNMKLNDKKLKEMQYAILDLEDKNAKTQKFSYKVMVQKIRDIIINISRKRS